jgi:UDP-N-acetylmuramate--alanine ligase
MELTTLSPPRGRRTDATLPAEFRGARIHLIGVGGSGMLGLAGVLLRCGARVSGSDRALSSSLQRLAEQGAALSSRQDEDSLPDDAQYVVASAAIPQEHPELAAARQRGLPVFKYAQMLGALMSQRIGVAVAGTHGKSTTTAWAAFTLRRAGLDPSFVIGAEVEQLDGGCGVGDGRYFVAEACEYDRSLLNLRPHCAAILNIDEDHLDYYRDLDEIEAAFREFAAQVAPGGLLVVNGQDARSQSVRAAASCDVESFGTDERDVWQARGLAVAGGTYSFHLLHRGKPLGVVRLGVAGRHNVYNALAVTAIAHRLGVSWPMIERSLAEFRGARRRLEDRGDIGGVRIADDYAHHPTEIRATLLAARERYAPRRLWCVFQPHQHSRTRFLLEDFASSFALADRIVVPDIYFVRDSQREREMVSAVDLVERIRACGGRAEYIPDFGAIVAALAEQLEPGDLVLTMGAGNIGRVADELVQRLRANLPT